MKLLGELACVEIADRPRVDFARIDLRIVDRFSAGFRDQIADRFAFLLQVALKIGAAAAENVDWFIHIDVINLAILLALSSRAAERETSRALPDLQQWIRGQMML